ncbi:MAG: PDDEXK nuclease domain-containing protein, partial [Candidatus Margulisiibacteriota bacterium]
ELGKGFSFVARQKRISTETQDFYIDLIFYNYLLKCFVLIDLKTSKLTHQDIGQMDMYVRLVNSKINAKTDNPAIGIILCADKHETIVKYSVMKDNKKIFASKYKLYLPTKRELAEEIEREKLMH